MKKTYQKPEVSVVELQIETSCMAALSITLSSNTASSGDAKSNNWDDDEDSEW